MAPFRRTNWRWRPYKRWRYRKYQPFRRPRRRYTRKTFRRRTRKRRYTVRRKKLPYLRLKQYQPAHIRKCKIKGLYCLLHCAHGRESNNYAMYQQTRAPHNYPAGGGFSILRFTLGCLYQDLEKLRNWWTTSNENLDLIRYTGLKLSFYRHDYVSYIVVYSLCNPMEISRTSFMNTHPYRLLLNHKKIIVPSFKEAPHNKKTKIIKRIRPPKQMVNKWFFQQDFQNAGLIMLHTSSISLNHMYAAANQKSNTIGLYCLNANIFQKANYAVATGYRPNGTWYYFGTDQHVEHKPTNKYEFIPLTAITHTAGKEGTATAAATPGNIFFHSYIHGDQKVWIQNQSQGTDASPNNLTELTQSLVIECRYNAYADTGKGNQLYLVTTLSENYEPTPSHDFYIDNLPLWLMVWGYLDWCRKLRPGASIDTTYQVVIRSTFIYPTMKQYVILDNSFVHNNGPWDTDIQDITYTQQGHWYPRVGNQEQAINSIALSGPAVPRAEELTQWEAHMRYTFYCKWGGCPTKIVQIADPNSQPKYPVPDTLLFKSQIQDPEQTGPENTIYSWDFSRDQIKESAIERISQYPSITDSTKPSTSKRRSTDPPAIQLQTKIQKLLQETQLQAQTQEESEETSIEQQLLRHRQQQQHLTLNILKLIHKLSKKQRAISHSISPIE
nr:MAG: ORF1 [TTV-like mini virus]UGV39595.1 MAG: ORF1 [TTV-like mini virus]